MTGGWQARGRINTAPVSIIECSPHLLADGLAVAVSPAGLHVSRDGGMSWAPSGRGAVGPFVRDLAVSEGGSILAICPGGLALSRDAGLHWEVSPAGAGLGTIAFTGSDRFLAGADEDGTIWAGRLDDGGAIRQVGMLPQPAMRLIATRDGVFAIGDEIAFSADGGSTWTPCDFPAGGRMEIAAPLGGRGIAVATDDTELRVIDDCRAAAVLLPRGESSIQALAGARNGALLAVATADRMLISHDSGNTWMPRSGLPPAISLALAADGSRLLAGLADGRVLVSDDLGVCWHTVQLIDTAVIVDLEQKNCELRATTAEGNILAKTGAGAFNCWQIIGRVPDSREVRFLSTDRQSIHVQAGDQDAWIAAPPLAMDHTIVEIITLEKGSVNNIVVASRSPDEMYAVWILIAGGTWRRVIAHPEPARAIALTTAVGGAGVFVGLGDSVYRPARLGAVLYAREIVDPERPLEVLRLKGQTGGDGRFLLTALTNQGLYSSDDLGLSWTPLPNPGELPITALALSGQTGELEIIAAELGGALFAHAAPTTL